MKLTNEERIDAIIEVCNGLPLKWRGSREENTLAHIAETRLALCKEWDAETDEAKRLELHKLILDCDCAHAKVLTKIPVEFY